jgi:hypothetical protein
LGNWSIDTATDDLAYVTAMLVPIVSAAVAAVVVEIIPTAACSREQETQAQIAIVER